MSLRELQERYEALENKCALLSAVYGDAEEARMVLLGALKVAADMLEFPSDHLTDKEWAKRAASTLRAAIAKVEGRHE